MRIVRNENYCENCSRTEKEEKFASEQSKVAFDEKKEKHT